MSMLVGMAMVALPECSPQGISNIAWALSKIGGDLLYQSEMDRIADVAITKVQEFNAQNVANVAGAFPSMRQSAPGLFSALAQRAAQILQTFKEQELAQFLWDNDARFQCHVSDVTSSMHQEMDRPLNFSRDQIGNIAWSYAVIGKMDRPFFLHIWRTLSQFEEQRSLKLEYPNLGLCLRSDLEEKITRAGKSKRFNQKTTSFQKGGWSSSI
ncbi:hypothetical protein SETIT_2G064900v2 [Setaria italica]|uniref:Uncharacterized protein n=1 Tax=Setaria italica TaxID=4555 RepID=A0A368PVS2_SETIT|nr:hypothetical protein SETIT_2G064900v2 [Setaria italica]